MIAPHVPVLCREVLAVFENRPTRIFFDGTVGAGGHAETILSAHPEIERYLACDRDPMALAVAKEKLAPWGKKVEWIHGPFSELAGYLHRLKLRSIDGFLIDIGISSMQLNAVERGFSFRGDGPLDMRMDPGGDVTAETLVNDLPEEELARIFYEYGEERRSRAAARAIVHLRKKRRIRTSGDLLFAIEPVLRRGKIHPATKIFQALRIAVNQELQQLQAGLDAAIASLSSGGRLAVISFHSLEDRIVKWRLKQEASVQILTKKPVIPSRAEIKANPRSRSAKLRAAEKIGGL